MTDTLLRHWLLKFSKTRKRVLTSFLYLLIVFFIDKNFSFSRVEISLLYSAVDLW